MLIALDVDGTLIDYDQVLSGRVATAVKEVAAAGHHVVIATGRSIAATTPIVNELGLDGFVVTANGAVTIKMNSGSPAGYDVVEAVTFDPRPVVELLRDQLPGALFAVETEDGRHLVSAPFPDGELGEIDVVTFERLVAGPTSRIIVRSPDRTAEDFVRLVEHLGLHGVAFAIGWTAWLDIAPEGVSKAGALELLRRRLGVEPLRTVAIGDGRNDVDMLQWAAQGIAMANATDEAIDAADEVCPNVDDDGLAVVLEALLMSGRA
ncbi:MAG: HAD family hydrolase [Micrococcales bacterium]|nr:MAG: HAD family hydrolase [Micrococcales bacterium]PIE27842.1 MAG: HAD family hydrolase [Micrococcales bacterium]